MAIRLRVKPTSPCAREVFVFDLETSVDPVTKSPKYTDGGRPYMAAHLRGDEKNTIRVIDNFEYDGAASIELTTKVVVGHNIKFDLEHCANVRVFKGPYDEDFLDYIRKNCVIWDTQFLTYLKSGHQMKFPSLEESCAYWGVPMTKTIDIGKELEANEWDITKIKDLDKYVANDVDMTHELYLAQTKDSWVMDNISWVLAMMQGLLGTFEIEHNGMRVDMVQLDNLKRKAEAAIMSTDTHMRSIVQKEFGPEFAQEFNPASYKHMRGLLYGGTIEFTVREPNGVVMTGPKMGQPRFKLRKASVVVPPTGLVYPNDSVDDDRLADIEAIVAAPWRLELVKILRKHRSYAKLHGTYLEGLAKHVRFDEDSEPYVYPQINNCLTDTGRTSSSKPNMQNNPTHDELGVRSIYVSRYGKEGCLVEVDFKQIEVIALALLSQDPMLRDDILKGTDIHSATGEKVFGKTMTKEQRRVVKTINFGLIYGGGAEELAKQAKIEKWLTKKIIDAFYGRYRRVKTYFEEFFEDAQKLLDKCGTPTGEMVGSPPTMQKVVDWQSITGRKYAFKDYFNDKFKKMSVSYTQTRNYPIQGLATGDLMMAAIGQVCRKLLYKKWENVKLIGLIHDSLIFDLKACDKDAFVLHLKYLLEGSGEYLGKICDFDWDLPVKVEFSVGPNLNEMKPITC